MDWFARRFVKASLVWLCVGAVLGVAMAVHPSWSIYRPAHMHAMLLGFGTMMIYGVGYHVLPRFAGQKLRSKQLAGLHFWVANIGLAAMIVGFMMRVSTRFPTAIATVVLAIGGLLSTVGTFFFAWNIWKSMNGAPQERRAVQVTPIESRRSVSSPSR